MKKIDCKNSKVPVQIPSPSELFIGDQTDFNSLNINKSI